MTAARWTAADLAVIVARRDPGNVAALAPKIAKVEKFHNIRTTSNEIKFQSKGEARLYDRLLLLQSAGEVLYFLRQCPLHLPGNTKYVLDFLVFWGDGRVRYLDFKGVLTATFMFKKKQVEALYPITVEPIFLKKGSFIGL